MSFERAQRAVER